MKIILTFLLLFVLTTTKAQSFRVDSNGNITRLPKIDWTKQTVSNSKKKRVLTIDFITDKSTSSIDVDYIKNVTKKLNVIYNSANIQFKIREVKHIPINLLVDDDLRASINSPNVKRLKITSQADILVVVVGKHKNSVIGISKLRSFNSNNARIIVDFECVFSSSTAAGLLAHELGHVFGLPHNDDERSVMHHIANNYTEFFLPYNLNYLKSLNLKSKNEKIQKRK